VNLITPAAKGYMIYQWNAKKDKFKPSLPGTDMSATSSSALHTGVAVPSSHNAS